MTPEERRAYDRERYKEKRDEILAKQRKRYHKMSKRKKERIKESKRKWDEEHREERRVRDRARYQTEEYRAKRRADYRIKHANDPMTAHRKAMIAAFEERTKYTHEEWKARQLAKAAEAQAKKDMRYKDAEDESVRKRETVIKYIKHWTKRKVFATTSVKNGEFMSEADIRAYYKESLQYFELQKRLEDSDPHDYSTRNMLSYKMRCIEDRFNTLLNKRTATKSKIINEL